MFNIEKYIAEKIKYTEVDFIYLDKIVTKIDLKKVLYKFYDDDIKMIKIKDEVSNETYNNLFNIFLNSNDYKLINSAFKLNDLLLDKKIIESVKHLENIQNLKNKLKR